MKILQLVAHPDLSRKSMTWKLATAFTEGAEFAGHDVETVAVFEGYDKDELKAKILAADHLNFAWPCWWELPPARLVDLLQTIFTEGFAFSFDGAKMAPKLDLPVSCIISMGQRKNHQTDHLSEAFRYCGMEPTFHIFDNVGPRLSKEMVQLYDDAAARAGFSAKGKQ